MSKYNEFYERKDEYFGEAPSDGLVKAINDYSIVGDTALDIGAGEGRNSEYLKSIGFDVTAVEPDIFGHQKILAKGISSINSLFLDYDGKQKFDFILAGTSLDQHTEDEVPLATAKLLDLLSPGGYAYILVFTEEDPESSECAGTVNHYFRLGELKALLTRDDIEFLLYDEYMKEDRSHGPVHLHGKAKALIRKTK